MFNPSAFKFNTNSGFEVRTNPKSYAGVQGPGYKNVDINLAKFFRINERVRVEFKMEAYNLANTFSGADPTRRDQLGIRAGHGDGRGNTGPRAAVQLPDYLLRIWQR